MNGRLPRSFTSAVSGVLAAGLLAVALLSSQVLGQAPGVVLDVLARDGHRTLPVATINGQEMVALDDLASRFQLTVRDDGGALTVAYKGRSVVLTPEQTIASVAGRLITLPAAPARVNGRWWVPVDFVSRALAPLYDVRLELRRASHLLIVGELRVPRMTVRVEPLQAGARIIVELTPAATTATTQQGSRLLLRVDADALDAALPLGQPSPLVQAIRLADAVNLAVELGPRVTSVKSTTQPIDNGTRVTIDLAGAQTDAAPAAQPPLAAVSPADAPALPSPSGTQGIRIVAVDAGHGGEDGGVKGVSGTLEKDLTLAIARKLKAALEARLGVRVIITRDDDRAVPAETRSALANNNKADLFISLHANASFRADTTGATAYTASFAEADLASDELAPERLPVFGGGVRSIEVVPWSLAQIAHRERSAEFAQTVISALGGRLPLAARPLERAPIRVLESANMPAILLEVGFLTNAAQEQALSGPDAQGALAQALVDAIVRFRDGADAEAPTR